MKIRLEAKVLDYAKKNKYTSIVIENTPVGCSCVGIHLHPQPEYCEEAKREALEKTGNFSLVQSEEGYSILVENLFLDLEEMTVLGKLNPFNKRMYLYAEVNKNKAKESSH